MLFPAAAESVRFPRIPGFSFSLAGAKVNQDLLVGVDSNKKSGMHLINVVAASLCRGALALFPLRTRRHSAVATTLRVHSVIRLSLGEWKGMPAAPEHSVGGR